MKSSDSSEAFTHYVIKQINPDVRNSLSKVQLEEIKSAISAGSPLQKHPLDVRGIIPLFFTQFYFVFLLGKDHRYKTKKAEGIRRRESDFLASIMFFIFFISPLLVISFLALYFTKTELGIDLFPESHLFDFLDF